MRALQGPGSGRLVMMLVVVAGVIGTLTFVATRLVEAPKSLLYGDLDPGDSSKIVAKLEGLAVPYDLRAGGSQIFVPSDRVLRLRLSMAEESLPRGGSVGYEVFDRSTSLGTTRSMQNINLLRALEGELARTIRSISQISAARVHLVLPKRELFNRNREEASASIVINQQGGTTLTRAQVAAIQHLVAAAVPGLKPTRISVVDTNGTLLARGSGDDDGMAPLAAQDHRAALEHRLKGMIEGLVERSVGVGKVRAEVSAEVDFDRVVTNSEIFDPESQVARSIQSVEEESQAEDSEGTQSVSVGSNLPDADEAGGGRSSNRNASTRIEETINYEITKTIRNEVKESGTIKRLSVAVLVDGVYTTDGDGERTYQPRSTEDMEQIATLVRSAIGYDAERGDTVEIVNMQFVQIEEIEPEEPAMFDLAKSDYFKMAEIAVLFVVGLLVVLLVLRPLATQILVSGDPQGALAGGGDLAALPQPGGAQAQLAAGGATPEEEEEDIEIDIANVEGRVKQSTLTKVGEIVDNHPDEALNIIRSWLYQEA